MATAYDVIKQALILCGAQQIGEAPEAAVAEIGKTLLNDLRAQWSTDGLTCFTETSLDVACTGAASYLFGDGAGAVATRPYGIKHVYYVLGQAVQDINPVSFEAIKGTPNIYGNPNYWAWDGALESRLWVYPIPTTGTLRCIYQTAFGQVANLSDTIADPPEYGEPLKFALAIRLAAALRLQTSQEVAAIAEKSYQRVRAATAARRPAMLKTDIPTAGQGRFNILTGDYSAVV